MFRIVVLFVFITVSQSEKINITKASTDDLFIINDDVVLNRLSMFLMLNKMNERIGGLSTINGELMKKIEHLEKKLNKLEEKNVDYRIDAAVMQSQIESMEKYVLGHNFNIKDSIKLTNVSVIEVSSNAEVKCPNVRVTERLLPADCSDVLRLYGNRSGVYTIHPPHSRSPVDVYCDQETRGGGWTVIQRRWNGSLDFYKDWQEYKNGFGDPHGEHWLGLETVHLLTNYKINELYFSMEDFNNDMALATYKAFSVGPENLFYPLTFLGAYEGTAGDSFKSAAGAKFSTYDRDNDSWDNHCAKFYFGAWWHKACFECNLNGKYFAGVLGKEEQSKGIIWGAYKGHSYSLMTSKMMIRPRINQVKNEAG